MTNLFMKFQNCNLIFVRDTQKQNAPSTFSVGGHKKRNDVLTTTHLLATCTPLKSGKKCLIFNAICLSEEPMCEIEGLLV